MNKSLTFVIKNCKLSRLNDIRNNFWGNATVINTSDYIQKTEYFSQKECLIYGTDLCFNHCIYNIKEDWQTEEQAIHNLLISLIEQPSSINKAYIVGDIIKSEQKDGRVIYALPCKIIVKD